MQPFADITKLRLRNRLRRVGDVHEAEVVVGVVVVSSTADGWIRWWIGRGMLRGRSLRRRFRAEAFGLRVRRGRHYRRCSPGWHGLEDAKLRESEYHPNALMAPAKIR